MPHSNMKFPTPLIGPILLAAAAFAQSVDIGAPASGTTVKAGSNITVEVDRPVSRTNQILNKTSYIVHRPHTVPQNTLTGSTEVAVVIGFLSCVGFSTGICPPPSEIIGSILYNGPYDPQFHTNVTPTKPPYQNFTVTIPKTAEAGPAQLSVTHFSLVGVSTYCARVSSGTKHC